MCVINRNEVTTWQRRVPVDRCSKAKWDIGGFPSLAKSILCTNLNNLEQTVLSSVWHKTSIAYILFSITY